MVLMDPTIKVIIKIIRNNGTYANLICKLDGVHVEQQRLLVSVCLMNNSWRRVVDWAKVLLFYQWTKSWQLWLFDRKFYWSSLAVRLASSIIQNRAMHLVLLSLSLFNSYGRLFHLFVDWLVDLMSVECISSNVEINMIDFIQGWKPFISL